MPKLKKAKDRDRKHRKKKHGMVITGRSVFILDDIIKRKSKEIEESKKDEQ